MEAKQGQDAQQGKREEIFLVPTDFSECAQQAVDYAADLCASRNARIILLHVTDPYSLGSLAGGAGNPGLHRQIRAAAEQKLRAAKERLGKRISVQTHMREGRAWQEIVHFARRSSPDLIIMGSHGYTGVKHLALGSTAERVVRHAPCSVLVVRNG